MDKIYDKKGIYIFYHRKCVVLDQMGRLFDGLSDMGAYRTSPKCIT